MKLKNREPLTKVQRVVGVIVATLFIASVLAAIFSHRSDINQTGTDTPSQGTQTSTSADANNKPPAKIGEPIEVKNIEFVVQKYDVSQEYNGHSTNGKFVVVSVDAKNVGKDPEMIDSAMFVLMDGHGRKYQNEPMNDVMVNHFAYDQINPGLSKSGVVSFEVPTDADTFTLGIRDNMFDFGGANYQYVRLNW